MHKLILIPLITVMISTSGCEDDQTNISQLDQINFKIVTLNVNKSETSIFNLGEDIVLTFKAINNSDETVELKMESDYLTCKVFQDENDFFLVNKKTDNYAIDSTFVPIGKPILSPINCLTINLPFYVQTFTQGETILDSAFWSSNLNNLNLVPGKYFTSFSLTLEIDDHIKTWKLRADFEIK